MKKVIGFDCKKGAEYQWMPKTTNCATSSGEKVYVRNFPELWDASIDSMIAATPKEQP